MRLCLTIERRTGHRAHGVVGRVPAHWHEDPWFRCSGRQTHHCQSGYLACLQVSLQYFFDAVPHRLPLGAIKPGVDFQRTARIHGIAEFPFCKVVTKRFKFFEEWAKRGQIRVYPRHDCDGTVFLL
ncbi:hypothetical protein D9M70_486590 [compost metagenome]